MKASLGPALVGHAFQQTALMAMLPLIADRLGLSQSAVGTVVAFGMAAAALAIPLIGVFGNSDLTRPSLLVMILCSLGLAALLLLPAPPALALLALLVLRLSQGLAAATLLVHAQIGSLARRGEGRAQLARTQSFGGMGRAASAIAVGPLAALHIVLPILPAIAGAMWSLFSERPRRTEAQPRRAGLSRPDFHALILPLTVQASLGVTHVSLAPLLAAQPGTSNLTAASIAGLSLAAANLGLVVAQRYLTAKAGPAALRLAALAGGAALLVVAALPLPAIVVGLSAVIGAASAMLLTCNLFTVLSAAPEHGFSRAAWNATASTAGLALGALAGSAGLHAGPSFSLTLSAALMASVALMLTSTRKTAT
ncbi:hypothetical protein E2A64_04795 [Pseudohoeflea suaedae]|uniref:MFS transporter n=1 Tax=Pseudohoeflea suaedae TaxID=877384 RepID=A0A4R5PN20_9HYPH|nr:MFS transporter [Pseudohoeflea suaedae]TDH38434.1 hypothetical protein E2A64_04795 [Pseudohoeflea suaedae]